MRTVRIELRKLRRKHFWLMAGGASAVEALWLGAALMRRAVGPVESRMTVLVLNEMLNLAALLLPLVAALLASRLVTVDTEGRMDQAFAAVGQRETSRFRGKLAIGAATVAVMQLALLALVIACGTAAGLRTTPQLGLAAALSIVALVGASIACMAVQLMLARVFDKQGIGLGIGTVAAIALSGLGFLGKQAIGWLLPWGVAVAASPIDQVASRTTIADVALVQHPALTAACAVLAGLWWVLVAHIVLTRRESRA